MSVNKTLIMSPKEKAEELVKKFEHLQPTKLSDYSRIYFPMSKQCALIVIDEVLYYSQAHGFIGLTEYYNEIRQEIENM